VCGGVVGGVGVCSDRGMGGGCVGGGLDDFSILSVWVVASFFSLLVIFNIYCFVY